MAIMFELTVTPEFWDQARPWPPACRPIVFSADAVMRNRGTVQVPATCADEVEQRLRAHPEVVAVVRVLRQPEKWSRRRAA
ncbi:MAG: hypothetical protein M3R24_19535 [Chloroflexota bacterium]|nr:hypothetical protein [Chloroflexota bacterium]PLS81007.1 MAG: hypothetical protein CYG59_06645 [Chloroflexota bacterium]